ncbi:reverse transcriptase [Plakobranchus ocellatus]|uniref:Reverse transcriptase n=1 Tax=Plakobranchus ocellatus TaxID=259542 RepID=A0AAV4CJJ3_9GAST|nr:reverse transcriptase [Plakobranchus ocellatus]
MKKLSRRADSSVSGVTQEGDFDGDLISGANQEGDLPGDPLRVRQEREEVAMTIRGRFISKWNEAFLGFHHVILVEILKEFTRDLLHTSNNMLSRNPVDAGHIDSPDVPVGQKSSLPLKRAPPLRPEKTGARRRRYVSSDRPDGRERRGSRRLYSNCNWEHPTQDEMVLTESLPTCDEIQRRLRKTTNTSPGQDRIEWGHLKTVDPTGDLLTAVLGAVHALGISSSWRKSRTVLIHKKGDTDDPGNFRPISLSSTLYKLYSGILAQRITNIATTHHWLSAEQKGFLPGDRKRHNTGADGGSAGGLPGHPNRSQTPLSPRDGFSQQDKPPPGITPRALVKTRGAAVTASPVVVPPPGLRKSGEATTARTQ